MKKAILLAMVVLAGLELVTRFVLFPQSKDIARFASYSARASDLSRSQAVRVAIVSNSSAEEGIDRPRLEALLRESLGRPVHVEMFLADGSGIVTWRAMLNRYFWSTGAHADIYVLNYFGSLRDSPEFEYFRVGMFFTKATDWPYYLNEQLQTFGQRTEFVLSSVWATYGARDRIRDRTLSIFVPGYHDFLDQLHWPPSRANAVSSVERPTYSAFDSVVSHIQSEGARLVLTAFPLRSADYDLEPNVLALAAEGRLTLCDLRHTTGLSPSSYRDDIHLIEAGRSVFTARYAAALEPILAHGPGQFVAATHPHAASSYPTD
jgi:hypothetical protein